MTAELKSTFTLYSQVDNVVRGAALSFRDLQEISLLRCSNLTDETLSTLLRSQRRPHQVSRLYAPEHACKVTHQSSPCMRTGMQEVPTRLWLP